MENGFEKIEKGEKCPCVESISQKLSTDNGGKDAQARDHEISGFEGWREALGKTHWKDRTAQRRQTSLE